MRFAFLLLPEFTLSPLSLFIDTLRLAGDMGDRSGRVSFDWQILGERGLPVRSSCGVEILPTHELSRTMQYDNLVLVGGLLRSANRLSKVQASYLDEAAKRRISITALCTASFALADCGLLDDYSVCVSWFHIKDFRNSFPNVHASAGSLYRIDRDRATCAGGAGAADLASHFVRETLGEGSAQKAANILVLDRIRGSSDPQPVGDIFTEASSRYVRRALLEMESNIQDRIPLKKIADRVSISRRQLERLFSIELGTSPAEAYLQLRVRFAATLLSNSDLSIAEIGYRSGFPSAGHFSRAFRSKTGLSPSEHRSRHFTKLDAQA